MRCYGGIVFRGKENSDTVVGEDGLGNGLDVAEIDISCERMIKYVLNNLKVEEFNQKSIVNS